MPKRLHEQIRANAKSRTDADGKSAKAPPKVSDAGLDTDTMDAERLAATAERPYVFLHDERAPLPAEIREPLRSPSAWPSGVSAC